MSRTKPPTSGTSSGKRTLPADPTITVTLIPPSPDADIGDAVAAIIAVLTESSEKAVSS